LVASRSGGDEGVENPTEAESNDKASFGSSFLRLARPPGDEDGAEVTVHLKVGYKTVLLVVVVFDLVHLSIRELFGSGFVGQLASLL
jgi:hypothetical protein